MMLAQQIGQSHELVVFTGYPLPDASQHPNFELRQYSSRLRLPAVLTSIGIAHAANKFDLLHGLWGTGGGRYASIAANLFRLPSVVSLLGGESAAVESIDYGSLLSRRSTSELRHTCQRASAVTVLSDFQKQQLRRNGFDTDSFRKIPLGVRSADFPYTDRNWTRPWKFVHVANINKVKDQATLLRAFDLIRRQVDATLKIVGPDYLDGQLTRLASDLGLTDSVEFVGAVPHSELHKYYQEAHIMLHSSLYESQGVVAMEAMSSGVAICATRVGLFADLDQEVCVTVPCGDFETLAASTLDLMHNPLQAQTLIAAGKEWANHHSAAWTARKYLDLYEELLRK